MPTFHQIPSTKKISQQGMTLVEILVVVALIGLITFVALPSVSNFFKISINSATREMAATIKESYNSTVVTGNIHRIAYDLENAEFWVESGPKTLLLDTEESKQKEEQRKRYARESDELKNSAGSKFKLEKTITRKKKSLPRGVVFEDIITEQSPEPIKAGIAYTHFFPQGLTEQTIIHLKDSDDHKVSLIIEPLIGRTTLESSYITGDRIFGTKK